MMWYCELLFLLTTAQLFQAQAQYTLTVKTGLSWGAGTDAAVKVRLGAESGNWSEIIPLKNNRNNFEHGGTDHFILPTDYLGAICHLTVWMTNKGGLFVDWQLDQIVLHDNVTSGDSVFNFNKWMRQEENASAVIHGVWGEWSPWNKCSRVCGGGRMVRTRSCDRPPPGCGGLWCQGRVRQQKPCAEEECTTTTTMTTTTSTTEATTTTTTEVTTAPTTEITTTSSTSTVDTTSLETIKASDVATTVPIVYANAGKRGKKKPVVRFSLSLPPLIMTSSPESTTPFTHSNKNASSTVYLSPMTSQSVNNSLASKRHRFFPTPDSTKLSTTYFASKGTRIDPRTTAVPTTWTAAARTWWVPNTKQWHRSTTAATPRFHRPNVPYPTTPRRHRYDWRQRRLRPTYYRGQTTYRPFLRLPIEHRHRYPRPRTTTSTTPTITTTLTSYFKRYFSVTNPTRQNWKEQTTVTTPIENRTRSSPTHRFRVTGHWQNPTLRNPSAISTSGSSYTEQEETHHTATYRSTTPNNWKTLEYLNTPKKRKNPPPVSSKPVPINANARSRLTEVLQRTSAAVPKATTTTSTTTPSPPPAATGNNGYPRIEKVRTSVDAPKYFTKGKSLLDDVTSLATQSSRRNLDVTIRSRIIQKDSATQDHNPSTRSNRHHPLQVIKEASRPVLPVYVIVVICISAVVVISVVIVSVYCAIVKSKLGHAAITAPANVTLQSAVPVQSNSYPMTVQSIPR